MCLVNIHSFRGENFIWSHLSYFLSFLYLFLLSYGYENRILCKSPYFLFIANNPSLSPKEMPLDAISFIFVLFWFSWQGFSVTTLAVPALALKTRLALNSQKTACLCPQSVGLKGVHHYCLTGCCIFFFFFWIFLQKFSGMRNSSCWNIFYFIWNFYS